MPNTRQPQTTRTSTVRDAAVQISAAQEQNKAQLIVNGLRARSVFPGDAWALGYLAHLAEWLTSTSKTERDIAKKEIRELVRLGRQTS